MSEFLSISEDAACQAIAAAVAAGVHAQPEVATATVIERLQTALGPVVEKIVALIQSGLTDLPAVLSALQAAGLTLPSWAATVVSILLALVKPAA